ncbi:sigma-70 family RNA polymerase sigma factor [Streptomyces sp. J2-1]|uniref:RNA polymerase sigma factor n=1 Tax=Streptomyces corallincola TaxID=2851888 RepID=UPI001C3823E6|nr:sigma-70 family RNA polymerase sigma factor [Streptomyces corallincola]MBV2355894.1 sigma-70 family RNA polymerase sigma factor [Streptomyces corallincola]
MIHDLPALTLDLLAVLRPALTAEAAAEAPACGGEPGDLEQAVWVRLLERLRADGPPRDPGRWVRRAVRAEARCLRRALRRRNPDPPDPAAVPLPRTPGGDGALPGAVRRLPGHCPRLLGALFSVRDLTYPEIAGELGISQGSIGPERARCLECLRRLLTPEIAARRAWG